MGFSNHKVPVDFYTVSKSISVNSYSFAFKWIFPPEWKLQPYMSLAFAFSSLELKNFGNFHYSTAEFKGNNFTISVPLIFDADADYSNSIGSMGLGCKLFILPQLCINGSVSYAVNWGSANNISVGSGGAFPGGFTEFNTYYDFGVELVL